MIYERISQKIKDMEAYEPPKGGDCAIRLNANECSWALPDAVLADIRREVSTISVNRYPDPASDGLGEAFAAAFACMRENVMVGNGSDEIIALLLQTMKGGPNGSSPSILLAEPTFAMYEIGAVFSGYEVIKVPCSKDLSPDHESLIEAAVRTQPSIVFLSNPNNPTGAVVPGELIGEMLSVCRGLVVVDEAYADFSSEPSWVRKVADYGNLAVLRTLSKVGGAALRCGFLVADRKLLGQVNKVRVPYNVSSMTQAAGEVMLKQFDLLRGIARDVAGTRDRLARRFRELGLEVFPSQANFLLVKAGGREKELYAFLKESGIMVKFLPRLGVAGDALRITVGTPEENDLLSGRIESFMAKGD